MKHKKTIILLLSIIMALSLLAGCDGSQDAPDEQHTQDTPNTEKVHSEAYEKIHCILKDSEFYYLDEAEALVPYYEMAAERKETILNSSTEIVKADEFIPGETYTGTAYYISPNGNNDNTGLSPETAWKTVERINWGDVQEGDAVFFERGGVYRLDERPLFLISNVTYSAYGEGTKPVLTLCQENSARVECWELWHDGENGEKIWKYYQQIADVGGIVLDDISYAKRIYEWPTPEGWLALNIQEMDPAHGAPSPEDPCALLSVSTTEEYRTVEEQLSTDLTYLSRVDLSNLEYPVDFGAEFRTGDLFLRCDAGNPGECFEDIAIIAKQQSQYGEIYDNVIDGAHANGWVLDNISVKHYGSSGIFGWHSSGKGAIIQNCTVEWGGNHIHQVQSEQPTRAYFLIGDGIYGLSNNVTIRNNYMRHGGNAFTFESNWETIDSLGTYSATGNLIENCGQGIRTYLVNHEQESSFDQLILKDNIIIDTGNSMNNACFEEPVAIDIGYESVQYADYIDVSENILIGSTLAMFRIPDSAGVEMNIHDNIIAQSRGGALITECTWDTAGGLTWHMMSDAKHR